MQSNNKKSKGKSILQLVRLITNKMAHAQSCNLKTLVDIGIVKLMPTSLRLVGIFIIQHFHRIQNESTMKKYLNALCITVIFSSSVYAQMPPPMMPPQGMPRQPQGSLGGQEGVMRDDPRRPVDQISRDLGVTPKQFRTCFNDVNPAPQGSLPGSNQKHANKQVLLSCLQRANPSITNNSLDAVMDQYRPGGRAAQ